MKDGPVFLVCYPISLEILDEAVLSVEVRPNL